MNVTFDTNCIIALEENRPDAMHLRRIVQNAAKQQLKLRVVAISASERQPDGRYSENFSVFRAKVANIGLGDVQILSAPAIVGMAYVGHSTVVSDQFAEEAGRIHEILFPTIPFAYEDFCAQVGHDPAAPGLDHKWRNRAVDTLALWTHMHNGGDFFVTSDDDFHGREKKRLLAQLGAGEILRPSEAAARLCPP